MDKASNGKGFSRPTYRETSDEVGRKEANRMTEGEKRQWVRENLPVCAAFAAEVAAVFGPDVRMVYACEGGYRFGRQSPVGIRLSETVVGSMREYSTGKGRNESR